MIWYNELEQLGITPEHIYYDLFKAQRLVQRLTQRFAEVNIKPISQCVSRIASEAQPFWIREVNICSANNNLVYAKTMIPYKLYMLHKATLDSLGTRPIGDCFIYLQEHIRSDFEYCIQNGDLLRRSTFTLGKHSILLTEYFMNTEFL